MKYEISYTNKEITPWGGMVFLRQMLNKIGILQKNDLIKILNKIFHMKIIKNFKDC